MKISTLKHRQKNKILLGLLWATLILPQSPAVAETTRNNRFNRQTFSGNNTVDKLRAQIMCAFEENGLPAGPTNQRSRAEYSANHLSTVMAQITPPLSSIMIHNMLAQAVAETGNLRNIVEQPSTYASSRSRYRGRGLIQMTHREN